MKKDNIIDFKSFMINRCVIGIKFNNYVVQITLNKKDRSINAFLINGHNNVNVKSF